MKRQTLGWIGITVCLAVSYWYSKGHSTGPEYFPSGRRITSFTDVLGAALLFSVVCLVLQFRAKK